MKRKEMKQEAKRIMQANYGTIVGVLALSGVILWAARALGAAGLVAAFFLPLEVGISYIVLEQARGKTAQVSDMFTKSFESKYYLRHVGGLAWRQLWIFLWSLLFFVPGIVKTYSYALTPYLLAEHKELEAKQALRKSMQLMEGKKGKLFCLHLSFIGCVLGWGLLICAIVIAFLLSVVLIFIYHGAFVASLFLWQLFIGIGVGVISLALVAFSIFFLAPYIKLTEGIFVRGVLEEAVKNGQLSPVPGSVETEVTQNA